MTISFIHHGGPQMASYRYRVQIPAKSLGAEINKYPADILIFSKPLPSEVDLALRAQAEGCRVVADFCDDHFDLSYYADMARIADLTTAATRALADRISRRTHVVPDTYEFEQREPHCGGDNLLWFGHASNLPSFRRLGMDHARVVSNAPGTIPWSIQTLRAEFARADIVLMPKTSDYKSSNRTIEAIRQGCFVAADWHPALEDFPIWKNGVKEGIAWAQKNRSEANQMIREAQAFVSEKYSPAIQAAAWKTALATLN